MARPGRVAHRQPRGDRVAAELEVLRGAAGPDPGRRVKAERLVDRHPQLGQLAEQLRRAWGVVADDAVALGRQPLGPLGVARELVEEEGHGRGRGVVAREQQRQHLVADLRVGEARALAVLGLDQEPEDVLAGLAGAPAAGDLAEDDPVEGAAHSAQAGERASRAADHLEEVLALIEGEAALEGGRHVDPGPIRVQPEQRPHRDPHRHVAGPVVEVDPIPRPPAAERALRLLGHHARGGRDSLAMKDRNHDLARAVVVLAVGGQEAIADQRDQVPEAAVAPAELVAVGDQDEAVGLRSQHEHVDRVEDPDREDRPVLLVRG